MSSEYHLNDLQDLQKSANEAVEQELYSELFDLFRKKIADAKRIKQYIDEATESLERNFNALENNL
jgi:S-adenosylmethionine/arginine decarboxylase-like enzyme